MWNGEIGTSRPLCRPRFMTSSEANAPYRFFEMLPDGHPSTRHSAHSDRHFCVKNQAACVGFRRRLKVTRRSGGGTIGSIGKVGKVPGAGVTEMSRIVPEGRHNDRHDQCFPYLPDAGGFPRVSWEPVLRQSPSVIWTSSHVTQCHVRFFAVDLSGSAYRLEPFEPHDTQRLHHHAGPDDLHRIRVVEGPQLNKRHIAVPSDPMRW
jgi:hypothetical protein